MWRGGRLRIHVGMSVLGNFGGIDPLCSASSIYTLGTPYFTCKFSFLMQCTNYSSGLITGSLCRPLCETREIEFEKCLGHGVKLHVLRAKWNGKKVILKTPKELGSTIAVRHAMNSLIPGSQSKDFRMTRKEFIQRVCTNPCIQ